MKSLKPLFKFIKSKWWASGLFWGFGMWLGTRILFPWIAGQAITGNELLYSFPIYIGFGMLWGLGSAAFKEESKEG
ncbi:MAG TPA: hypothetical protein VFV79_05005 [Saprospiraceae bacterium]|nr:hypothetical protein [Saprospiraceae bacterium]